MNSNAFFAGRRCNLSLADFGTHGGVAFSRLALFSLTVVVALTCAGRAFGDSGDGLKTIDNPGGGQAVYGPLTGVSSARDAMARMLRQVHGRFGDRPVIGKFFQSRNSDSVATFFTLTAARQGGKRIAGLVIVAMPSGATPAGAVLYDDESRFGKTEPELMKKLTEAWGKANVKPAASASAGASGGDYPVQPLQQAAAPDNSGSIGLPAGWHVTGGGGGAIHAEGPRGESIHMGVINGNIYDPSTPQGQNMIAYMRKGSTPFTVCPFSRDLVADYQCVAGQNRQRRQLPQLSMHVIDVKSLPANQYELVAALVSAEIDFGDGKGPMKSSIRLGANRTGAAMWNLNVNQVSVPNSLADQEWPTMRAMVASYRQNGQVIQAQANQVIAEIHARGEANTKLAEARSAANDAHNAAVEQRWDEQAKENKAFENYTLDRSVVQDNEQSARGTFTYPTADALVKSDPSRFQYVPTQDLLKGIDY